MIDFRIIYRVHAIDQSSGEETELHFDNLKDAIAFEEVTSSEKKITIAPVVLWSGIPSPVEESAAQKLRNLSPDEIEALRGMFGDNYYR